MTSSVSLVADSGAAAGAQEFFRSTPFLRAEGVTHTLVVERGGARTAIPLIVRDVDGQRRDAISPYGYPGGSRRGVPLHGPDLDLSGIGLVSVFVRDRLLDPVLSGGRSRSTVLLHDPARGRHVREAFARNARKNIRAGLQIEVRPGPNVEAPTIAGFADCYDQTMARVGAADRYLFPRRYLRECLDFPASWLVVARDDQGVCAGMIVVASDGLLHYYLGGTAERRRASSPVKNCFLAAMDLADDMGMPLNLGGGLRPGDGLEDFKRGFANAEEAFVTHEMVGDRAAYAELSAGCPDSGWFPAYRAPAHTPGSDENTPAFTAAVRSSKSRSVWSA